MVGHVLRWIRIVVLEWVFDILVSPQIALNGLFSGSELWLPRYNFINVRCV